MSATHTPGPWFIGKSADGTLVIKPDTGTAPWNHGDCVAAVRPTERAMANAALVSAAPELLQALEGALDVIQAIIPGPHRTIRDAIAKATGDTK